MIENNPSNVSSGLEMLLEEIEAEIDFFTRIGSRAFESRDFRKVDEARTQAEKVTVFLDKVHKAMKPILKDVDHEPLASDPDMPRWRNSAQWARNTMRQEDLLKDDSPHGTSEITDAGRARLKEGKQAAA